MAYFDTLDFGDVSNEKIKNISLCIHTNLGRSCRKISEWGWEELAEQLFGIVFTLDKERQDILKKHTGKKLTGDIKENFREFLNKMKELDDKRYQEYKEKCIKGKQEEKERKKRRKELLRKK